jgi:hypothetical protein
MEIAKVLPKIVPHCVDIWEHFPTLVKLASKCQSVVEMGVRGGCSAYALAAGLEGSGADDKWMLYLDINNCQNPKLEELCKTVGIKIKFQQADSRYVELPECDLLFIDTLHTYGQLKTELEIHHCKAKRYIVMHDTEAPWGNKNEVDDGSPDKGLRPAVDDFLAEHKDQWELHSHHANCHGLTVLERI